jgi:hypothetical protein
LRVAGIRLPSNSTDLVLTMRARSGGGGMYWGRDWLWGLPVIVLTITLHICAFVLIERMLVLELSKTERHAGYRVTSITIVALIAITLHAFEAAIWAILYIFLKALPEPGDAILYSLSSITAFGHAPLFLDKRWQLLGAMEAMNGVILFGLTTAFLFAAVQLARPDRKD